MSKKIITYRIEKNADGIEHLEGTWNPDLAATLESRIRNGKMPLLASDAIPEVIKEGAKHMQQQNDSVQDFIINDKLMGSFPSEDLKKVTEAIRATREKFNPIDKKDKNTLK